VKPLDQIEQLVAAEDYVEAGEILDKYLIENPHDARALYYAGNILYETGKTGIAMALYEKANRVAPDRWMIRLNHARCVLETHHYEDARTALLALYNGGHKTNDKVLNNLAAVSAELGDHAAAIKWANASLDVDPTQYRPRVSKGFSQIALGDYERGWRNYAEGIGHQKWRDFKRYQGEPEWRPGLATGKVIVYAEQGLGDQILMVDAVRSLNWKVAIECHPKLEGLFARSFPECEVHGTQLTPVHTLSWPAKFAPTASVPFCKLNAYLRDKPEKWDRKPWLKSCPIRRNGWLANLRVHKPVIGVAWTAGFERTNGKLRSTSLETLLPMLKAIDAHWVCLEYKDRSEELQALQRYHGITVHDYPWATQSNDYDDTAALVDCLDAVVAPPTTVVHAAGALGIPVYCITPPNPHAFFGVQIDELPYYRQVKVFRRRGSRWDEQVRAVTEELYNALRRDTSRWSGASGATGTGD
jgi:tetratricopeptide (TPR) repeat protein